VERNPVRAGLVARPEEYPWSSAAAHVAGRDDSFVKVAPLLEMVVSWREFLLPLDGEDDLARLRKHERTGRPLGSEEFLRRVESATGRTLRPLKRGPGQWN
jgi:putative transposase